MYGRVEECHISLTRMFSVTKRLPLSPQSRDRAVNVSYRNMSHFSSPLVEGLMKPENVNIGLYNTTLLAECRFPHFR